MNPGFRRIPEKSVGTLFQGHAYFHADCRILFFAYYHLEPKKHPLTDPFAVGGKGSRPSFQVQPNPQGGCNPCLPATGHNAMYVAMADGSVRSLTAGMDRRVWWALVTSAGRDRLQRSVTRGAPFGDERWQTHTAAQLGWRLRYAARAGPRR